MSTLNHYVGGPHIKIDYDSKMGQRARALLPEDRTYNCQRLSIGNMRYSICAQIKSNGRVSKGINSAIFWPDKMQMAAIKSRAETKTNAIDPVNYTWSTNWLARHEKKEEILQNPNQILCYFYVENKD